MVEVLGQQVQTEERSQVLWETWAVESSSLAGICGLCILALLSTIAEDWRLFIPTIARRISKTLALRVSRRPYARKSREADWISRRSREAESRCSSMCVEMWTKDTDTSPCASMFAAGRSEGCLALSFSPPPFLWRCSCLSAFCFFFRFFSSPFLPPCRYECVFVLLRDRLLFLASLSWSLRSQ